LCTVWVNRGGRDKRFLFFFFPVDFPEDDRRRTILEEGKEFAYGWKCRDRYVVVVAVVVVVQSLVVLFTGPRKASDVVVHPQQPISRQSQSFPMLLLCAETVISLRKLRL
jgi:hypothetical protein